MLGNIHRKDSASCARRMLPLSVTRNRTEPRTCTFLSKSLSQAHISARKSVRTDPEGNDIFDYSKANNTP